MPKYAEGAMSPSGQYVVQGGRWVPVTEESGPEGSALGRFFSGLWETTGKPAIEAAPELVKTAIAPPVKIDAESGDVSLPQVEFWRDMISGAYGAHKEQFKKASDAEGIPESVGHVLAGLVPLVGPAAAEAGERMAEGDVAGGLGEGVGLALPFARPFKALGRGAKAVTEGSAGRNILRGIKARPGQVEDLLPQAKEISETLGIGGAKRLSRKAGDVIRDEAGDVIKETGKVKEAKDALAKVKASPEAQEFTMSMKDAVERVRKNLDPIEAPKALETFENLSFKERAKALEGLTNEGRKNLAIARRSAIETLDTEAASAAKKLNKQLETLDAMFGEEVPGEALFKARTQLGRVAKKGNVYERMPGVQATAKGEAAEAARSAITDALHKNIAGLAEADLSYSTWRKVSDNLKKVALKEAVEGAPAYELAGGAQGMRTLLMKLGGAAAGGGAATAAGGGLLAVPFGVYGGFQVVREIVNSPLWNTLSARAKYNLAEALGEGFLAKGTATATAAGRALEEDER